MHDGQRVAWNAALMLAKQVVMAGLSVMFVGYLARTVGVVAWGEFQASLAIVAIVSIIAGLGVRGYLAREIAVRPELGPRHLGSALLIRGLLGALILALIATISLLTRSGDARYLVPIVYGRALRLSAAAKQCKKIKVLSVARLLGESIRRIHHGDSISSLFI